MIGLGGGGLPVFLSRYLQLHTRVAELDPEVAKLAAEHFRCCGIPALQVDPFIYGSKLPDKKK